MGNEPAVVISEPDIIVVAVVKAAQRLVKLVARGRPRHFAGLHLMSKGIDVTRRDLDDVFQARLVCFKRQFPLTFQIQMDTTSEFENRIQNLARSMFFKLVHGAFDQGHGKSVEGDTQQTDSGDDA